MEQRIAESFGPALADTRLQAAGQDKKGNPASRKRSWERRSAADRGVNKKHDTKIYQLGNNGFQVYLERINNFLHKYKLIIYYYFINFLYFITL